MAPFNSSIQNSATTTSLQNAILGSFAVSLVVLFLLVRRYTKSTAGTPPATPAGRNNGVGEKQSGSSTSLPTYRALREKPRSAQFSDHSERSPVHGEVGQEIAPYPLYDAEKWPETSVQHFPVRLQEGQYSDGICGSPSVDLQTSTQPHHWTSYKAHIRFPAPEGTEDHPSQYDGFLTVADTSTDMLASRDDNPQATISTHHPTLQKETIQMFPGTEGGGKPQKWRRRVLEYG